MMKKARFSTKMHGQHPTKINEKCAILDENAWIIALENNEQCAILDENAWAIVYQNDEKRAIVD